MMRNKQTSSQSDHIRAWSLFQSGQLSKAKRIYEKICRKSRNDDGAWVMLGIILAQQGSFRKAETSLQRALAANTGNFDALINLGLLYYQQGMFEQSMQHYRQALVLNPDHADALVQTGNVCARQDLLTDAEDHYRRALKNSPAHSAALGNLANVLSYQGRSPEAIPLFRKVLQMNPGYSGMHSNLLLCLHYPDPIDPPVLFEEHRKWSAVHCRGVRPYDWSTGTAANRDRLRIGYVTPDLREHSVAYFFKPLLVHHDRTNFDIFCYYESRLEDNAVAGNTGSKYTLRSTLGLSDDQAAEIIRQDRIDILVDLAGHTENNRLPVFARRPAPVQMTYLGYPDTTGLDTIDYRITDHWADPPGRTEHFHSESLLRLENGFLCFSPPVESPDITSLPYDANGYITFGSFNVLTKITPDILAAWSHLLGRMPEARLLIKNRQLTDDRLKLRLSEYFQGMGINAERIELSGRTSKSEHMATYGKVDIALDSFPYNGTTTTCDTLWMGIPVVTLAGSCHVSRVGVSILSQVELDELVTESREEYIDCAVELAGNPARIRELRHTLREKMRSSSLSDGEKFTQGVETLYIDAWNAWHRHIR